jgi:hypothetical protein
MKILIVLTTGTRRAQGGPSYTSGSAREKLYGDQPISRGRARAHSLTDPRPVE